MGQGGSSAIEAEFRGSDPKVLRHLVNQLVLLNPFIRKTKIVVLVISRKNLADALAGHYLVERVGVYRESDNLIPIIARRPKTTSASINDIEIKFNNLKNVANCSSDKWISRDMA